MLLHIALHKLGCQLLESQIYNNIYLGQISTIMRVLTRKNDVLLSHFEKNDETQAENNIISLKYHHVNNHDLGGKKGKN